MLLVVSPAWLVQHEYSVLPVIVPQSPETVLGTGFLGSYAPEHAAQLAVSGSGCWWWALIQSGERFGLDGLLLRCSFSGFNCIVCVHQRGDTAKVLVKACSIGKRIQN